MTGRARAGRSAVTIGALVPLSPPGWVEAGRQLLAGLELAVADVNRGGGVGGRPVTLAVRDTAATPRSAVAAVDELEGEGAVALVGEYHSVVARAVAARADALGLPFLCSSAVIDTLTDRPTDWVARLATPQSRGWKLVADHLLDTGHTRVAIALEQSAYWQAGAAILTERLATRCGSAVEHDLGNTALDEVCASLIASRHTALVVLAGHPRPAAALVRAVRSEPGLEHLAVACPAGQPELPSWVSLLGPMGNGIPFLRYVPSPPTTRQVAVESRLAGPHPPSFVALEGYDSILFLAAALRLAGPSREGLAASWGMVGVDGTRGSIRLERDARRGLWQWHSSPVLLAERDPHSPLELRVVRRG